jgi:YHS domain-containing protein
MRKAYLSVVVAAAMCSGLSVVRAEDPQPAGGMGGDMKGMAHDMHGMAGDMKDKMGGMMAHEAMTNKDANSVAVHGYDVTSYFDGTPVKGNAEITAVYQGAIYRFATEVARDKFKAEPAKFAPQLGGFCSMGCTKGMMHDADPTAFTIVDGKLYLNSSKEANDMFAKDPAAAVMKGQESMKKMAHSMAPSMTPSMAPSMAPSMTPPAAPK